MHDLAVAELAAAAGLLLVPGPRPRLLADRLQVRHARLVQLDLDAEAALEPLDGHLDVHLRQPGEELLARLLVAAELQRRVLLGQPPQRPVGLVLVALRLGVTGEAHHRRPGTWIAGASTSRSASSSRSPVCVSLSLATAPMSPAHELRRRHVLLALQREQLAEPLLRVGASVRDRRVGLHASRRGPGRR